MLSSTIYDSGGPLEAQEFYHSRGWTDGLPVVLPTEEAVSAYLQWNGLPASHLIGIEPVRNRVLTAEKVAINALMAGCLPMHLPVIITALSAMLEGPFSLHGATASTGGCAILMVVNGPIRQEIGMQATFNVLAGSDRASSVIGRAIRLCLINLLDVRSGGIDRSTLGHPGKFSYCLAEDEENSPWPSVAKERGIPAELSAVTVMAAGAPRQLMNEWTTEPEEILETFAAEIRANMRHYSIWPGNYAIIIPKQLRTHLHNAGWSKSDIRHYVHKRSRIKRKEWAEVGKGVVIRDKGELEYSAMPDAEHLLIIAAGGPAGGFGAVIPPWLGHKSEAVSAPIGVCLDCEPLAKGD